MELSQERGRVHSSAPPSARPPPSTELDCVLRVMDGPCHSTCWDQCLMI